MSNTYSRAWFEIFLETRPSTAQELAFLSACLPNPPFARLLDLACGQGRHANPLAEQGYSLLGVDRDAAALEIARRSAPPGAGYLQADLRRLGSLSGPFDAAFCMWQSFGHFTPDENRALLAQVARLLRPGGRFVLDIYHPGYWEAHLGGYQMERNGLLIQAANHMQGDRLSVQLRYPNGEQERFEWQLFTPAAIQALAGGCGLRSLQTCSGYNLEQPVSPENPLVQYLFEKAL